MKLNKSHKLNFKSVTNRVTPNQIPTVIDNVAIWSDEDYEVELNLKTLELTGEDTFWNDDTEEWDGVAMTDKALTGMMENKKFLLI